MKELTDSKLLGIWDAHDSIIEYMRAAIAADRALNADDRKLELLQQAHDRSHEEVLRLAEKLRQYESGNGMHLNSAPADRDVMRDALEEIALAGMSPSPEMSSDGVQSWHARRAWEFIGIAARALAAAPTPPSEQQGEPLSVMGGRESLEDALAIVESFGPGIEGLNDTYARQTILADEVKRLRGLYEQGEQEPDLTPQEILASRLITAWVDTQGKQIPWGKAVEIAAIVTKIPESERQRLLALNDSDTAVLAELRAKVEALAGTAGTDLLYRRDVLALLGDKP